MVSPFEDFINGMTESQYEFFLDNEATEKQKEKALRIREELSEEEAQIQQEEIATTQRQNRVIEFFRRVFRQ